MAIVKESLTIYDSLKPRGPNDDTYTVVATISDINEKQVLAIASGTQACLKVYQDDLQDCHAESLVKRAYKRYLINSLLLCLKASHTLKQFEQVVSSENGRDLALFISQFPCGLIRRYEGEEPVDELTGKVIKRKPGRGIVVDGKTYYVEKSSCLEKIQNWYRVGFQGKHLAQLFNSRAVLKKVMVGKCEPDEDINYEKYAEQLRLLLPSVEVEIVDSVRRDEFLYAPEKQPKPVALVATKQPCNNYEFEYVVDGRKRGLAKKHCSKGLNNAQKLSICNSRLRDDLKLLEEMYAELKQKPGT